MSYRKARGEILLLVALFAVTAWSVRLFSQTPAMSGQNSSVLGLPVAKFDIEQSDMMSALKALREKDYHRILIGFETVGEPKSESALISLHVENETVGGILQHLCREDPRYAFEVVGESRMVNVYFISARNDPANLLNIRVSDFVVNERVFPQTLITGIAQYAPELREYLDRRQREYWMRTGKPGGSPGSILSGDASKPMVTIHLKEATVREILNAITLYTSDHAVQLGLRFPVGWSYRFVPDPTATNGLDGRPKWDIF